MRLFQLNWPLPILLVCLSSCLAELQLVHEWKYIDYVWIDDHQKQDAIACGEYNYTNIWPTDYQLLPDGRALLTTPRFYNNPASLSIISNDTAAGGPLLAPFPDWSWHKSGNCSVITSVSRVFLDSHNNLWFVDSGKIGNEQVCPAKLLQFDIQTKELLLQVDIPLNLTHNPNDPSKGRLEIQVIEEADENIWVYMSDKEGYGLLIWDKTDIWRLDGEVFCPTIDGEQFSIDGENFTLGIGPQGLLITPPGFLKQTYLMMKPMSSIKTFMASTDELHKSKTGSKVNYYISDINLLTQEPAKAFTKSSGLLIAAFTTRTALGCWNLQNPLTDDYVAVVETNSTTLQYVDTAKITPGETEEEEIISILTNRLQKYVLKTMNFDEINFRVMRGEVNSWIAGTVCEPEQHEVVNSIEAKNFTYFATL